MNVARSALAMALSCTFVAIVAFAAGCSSTSSEGDCRDSNGDYESEFLGCRGNKKAECHVEYLDCDRERCRREAVSIQLAECPPDRPICQDQRDVNGPVSICHAQALDKSCRAELVVDGAPFVPELIADLDHDGRSDLLRRGNSAREVMVALANPDGSFRSLPPLLGDYGIDIWLADVDGDDNLDLVTGRYELGPPGQSGTTTLFIAAGRGDGTFRAAVAAPSLGDHAWPILMLDVNGDKRADLVSWEKATHQFTVLLGGQGPLVRSAPSVVACDLHDCPARSDGIQGGDLNGDGFEDFVHVDKDGRLVPVLGSATGILTRGPRQPTFVSDRPANGTSVVLADLDADGHLDFVERSGERVWIRPGNGDATFRDVIEVDAAPYQVDAFRVGDLDGDGRPDLLFADRDEVVIVRKNTGPFTFAPPKVYQPGPSVSGFLGALTPAPGVAPSIVVGSFLVPASCR